MALFYVLYLLSGFFKGISNFYGFTFPVDFTLLTALILILHITFDYFFNGVKVKFQKNVIYSFIFLLLFFFWILLSLIYGKSQVYAYKKTFLFVTNIIAFLYPLLISEFPIKKFLRYLSLLVVVFFIWFFYVYFILTGTLKGTEIYYRIMGMYLTLGITGGLILLVFITSRVKIFYGIFVDTLLIIILLSFVIISGARGPLLFVFISLFFFGIYKLFNFKIKKNVNLKKLFYVLFIGIPGIIVFLGVIINKFYSKILVLAERSLFRLFLLTNNVNNSSGMGSSVDVRIEQYKFALHSVFSDFTHFLYGYGFGSFGIMYSGEDVRLYPHNIFLEIWFELGFIGLVLFSLFLISVFFLKFKSKIYVTGFVMFYIILNMMKSSSIVDIRLFFAFFALFIINQNIVKHKTDLQ